MKSELSTRNPFTELGETRTPFRNFITSLWGNDNGLTKFIPYDNWNLNLNWTPAVDIEETDQSFLLTADLPDVQKKDMKVTIEDGLLVIKAERDQEERIDERNYHRIERFHGNYERSFQLPEGIDTDKMNAQLSEGTLKITLPKVNIEKKQPAKEIAIS